MSVIDRFDGEHRYLSNFYGCGEREVATVKWEGIVYPTTEHAFQAAKTFRRDARAYIAGLPQPGQAKRAGRALDDLRPDWEAIKDELMLALVRQKFTIHEFCRGRLLETGDAKLVEGNDWGDDYWGRCPVGERWAAYGDNKLGQILMAVRLELRVLGGAPAPSAQATLI